MQKSVLSLLLVLLSAVVLAQKVNSYWPKQIELDNYVITIYTPEPEKFDNNQLHARAAFSLFDRQHLPVFGAMWFRCRVQTDVPRNEVYFTDIELINANFPSAHADNVAELQRLIDGHAPTWQFNSDLQAFYCNVQEIDINNSASEELKSNPPTIYYATEPTELVYIDGAPILANISGSELYQYVVNTPHFILKSKSDQNYYLKGGDWWYASLDPTRAWKPIESPPYQVMMLAEKALELTPGSQKKTSNVKAKQPKLMVTTVPAELIQTQGEPELKQIHENLFSVSNSTDEIVFDSYSDYYYILIAGRWYRSKYLNRNTWSFVPPAKLPAIFKEIPPSSPFAHLRLSVPGTPESVSAALNNSIPQTAIVDRFKTKMLLEYDGEPVFDTIPGTSLKYAVNTAGSVLAAEDGKYYAVDQGIWFVSASPTGPWHVADQYPLEVRRIPPNCPVFNMKFVHIYDATDEVVYVGYTPGYLGAFLYQGVVFYGTGYRYKSWFGDKYIPKPTTYGYGASKKVTQGANVSFHAGIGFGGPMMGVGFGGYPYGYGWGMGYGGYYGGYALWNQMAYNQYYYAGQTVTVDHNIVEEQPIDLKNIYNNRVEGIIRTETAIRNDPMKPVILKDRKAVPNQLYADELGNVYRQDEKGNWYAQNGSGWEKIERKPE